MGAVDQMEMGAWLDPNKARVAKQDHRAPVAHSLQFSNPILSSSSESPGQSRHPTAPELITSISLAAQHCRNPQAADSMETGPSKAGGDPHGKHRGQEPVNLRPTDPGASVTQRRESESRRKC